MEWTEHFQLWVSLASFIFFTIILTLVCPRLANSTDETVGKGKRLIITLGNVGKSHWNHQQKSSPQCSHQVCSELLHFSPGDREMRLTTPGD